VCVPVSFSCCRGPNYGSLSLPVSICRAFSIFHYLSPRPPVPCTHPPFLPSCSPSPALLLFPSRSLSPSRFLARSPNRCVRACVRACVCVYGHACVLSRYTTRKRALKSHRLSETPIVWRNTSDTFTPRGLGNNRASCELVKCFELKESDDVILI